MDDGDLLLLEVYISPMTPEQGEKTLPPASAHGSSRRVFYSRGLAAQCGEAWDTILTDYEARVIVRPGYTDVPGAHSVDVVDGRTGTHIQSSRRYNVDALVGWMRSEFEFPEVLHREFVEEESRRGWAVLLAKKRS